MEENFHQIILPGLDKQIKFLEHSEELNYKKVLVIGSNSEMIASSLAKLAGRTTELIVEDYDSLMNARMILQNSKNVNVRIMDFENTDFETEFFDIVYAQASISTIRRNKIVKEIKRILKPGGKLCAGEIILHKPEYPVFIKDILDRSELAPLSENEIVRYYQERNFELSGGVDLSGTLKEFYSLNIENLQKADKELSQNEKAYYKKLIKKISHESNAFLELGAGKFIGFKVLLLIKI